MSMIRQCVMMFGIMLMMQSTVLIGASGSGNFSSLTKEQAQEQFSKKFKQALMLGDAFTESELDGLIKAGANINMPMDIPGKGANQYLVPLVVAAQSGKVDLVKLLLKKGVDIAVKDERGHTAFDVAANEGIRQILQKQAQEKFSEKIVEQLKKTRVTEPEKQQLSAYISVGADVNQYTGDGTTYKKTLIEAAKFGNRELVEYLLQNNANVNVKDSDGSTALFWAAVRGDQDLVKLLIDKGADVNEKDNQGSTALHVAAQHEHSGVVVFLLENDADFSAKNNKNETAFDLAQKDGDIQRILKKWEIQQRFSKKVEEIISKKDMTEADKSALKVFFDEKDKQISIDWYYFKSANKKFWSKRNILGGSLGNKAFFEWLVKHGANVDFKGAQGRTLLQFAALNGNKSFVEQLLDHGAKINAQDNNGQTALMLAALKSHQDVVKLLIEKGADASLADKNGSTAFNLATDQNIRKVIEKSEVQKKFSKKVLEVLGNHDMTVEDGAELKSYVDAGADVNQQIADTLIQKLPLLEAIMNNQIDFVRWLLANGANINAIADDAMERTIFMDAVAWGNKEIIKFLLEKGADVNAKDKDGKTAFDFALDQEIKQLFQKAPITDLDRLKGALTALKAKLAALAGALEQIKKK